MNAWSCSPDQTTRLRTMYERQMYFIFFKLPCLSNLAYALRSVIWLFPTSTSEQALHSVLRSTSRLKAESFSWAPAISDELIAFYFSREGSKLFLPLHPFYLRKIHQFSRMNECLFSSLSYTFLKLALVFPGSMLTSPEMLGEQSRMQI